MWMDLETLLSDVKQTQRANDEDLSCVEYLQIHNESTQGGGDLKGTEGEWQPLLKG